MKLITKKDWMSTRTWIDLEGADIQSYMARISDQVGYDLKRKLQEWHDRGVVVFEGVVDSALIEALLSDVEYLRRHHKDFELSAEIKGVQREIASFTEEELDTDGVKFNSIHTISRAAGCLSLTAAVTEFLDHVFASPACALQSLTFYRGSQQPAHVDYPYVRCQTKLAHLAASWIPLEDIHPHAGPLAYYPGSHKPEISGFFDWGNGSVLLEPDSAKTPIELSRYLEERVIEAGIEPEIFLPRRGDVLIWHGNLIHEGTAISNPVLTRKSYVTHYTSLDAYPQEHRRRDGAGLAVNGGYAYDYPWLAESRNQLPSSRCRKMESSDRESGSMAR
jgi:ectoine hydroxylase-related dioxygenase (phytanoyl-CoA dioxygenase family)